jgi:hypothetical protein
MWMRQEDKTMTSEDRYLVAHQTRDHEPTDYENLLAEGLERAYGRGIQELSEIVKDLNATCVPAPGGQAWSEELFISEMKRLGV